jgi:hypothetical protein
MLISRCLLAIALLYFLRVGTIIHNWGILLSVKPFATAQPYVEWLLLGALLAIAVLLFWSCKKITGYMRRKNQPDGSGRAVQTDN